MPDFPVYVKGDLTQIAATPQREVELQFDGWTKREDKPAADVGSTPAPAPKTQKSPTK